MAPNANGSAGDPSILRKQHQDYAQQLEALQSRPRLSDDEQREETRLKKLKLHIKDQLNELESHNGQAS